MKGGKNLHLEHLEDEIINKGSDGGKQAIKILKEMGRFLSSEGTGVNVTTKWDGAPAVICGTDPADGRFFVGTKSVFAKTEPKVCKSDADINKFYNGALAQKLSASLRILSKCNIKGVLQGDLMFTDDKKREKIDGESFITFRPNTITYAIQPNSDIGKSIDRAALGIVFHTKYTGRTLPEMTSSFRIDPGDYRASSDAWIERAEFKNLGKAADFTGSEKAKYDAAVRKAEGSLKQASSILDKIQSGQKTLEIDTEFKKFFNKYVKEGRNIPSVKKAFDDFNTHMQGEYKKAIDKVTRQETKQKKTTEMMKKLEMMNKNKQKFEMLIASYMNIQVAKQMLVNKMKQISALRLFVQKANGDYEVTTPEGFVAIDGKNAVKIIDRLEFSRLNFTVPKNWG